jgi:hypothetical protein
MAGMHRASLVLLLLVATACGRSRPATAVPPAAPARGAGFAATATSSTAERDANVTGAGARSSAGASAVVRLPVLLDRAAVLANRFCAAAELANQGAMQDAPWVEESAPAVFEQSIRFGAWNELGHPGHALAGSGTVCLPMRDGSAWAIEYLHDKSYRWTLAHYSADGQRQALGPMRLEAAVGGMLGPSHAVAFDFDGDGLEEFWVENSLWCGWEPAQKLYTFRAGSIVPYPVPHDPRVDEIYDVDEDGRPDLLTRSPLEVEPVPCTFGDIVCAGYGFERVLHSLPDGTFAEGDLVARRYAEERCQDTAMEQPLVVHKDYPPAEVDGEKTANAIACARLRGVPSDRIITELHARCPSVVHSREARRHPNPLWGPAAESSGELSAAELVRRRNACPAPPLHTTCIDWMFDLARATPTPILRQPRARDAESH